MRIGSTHFILTALVIHAAFAAGARADQPLTLAEALKQAAANNTDLRRTGIEVKTADAQLLASTGAFDVVLGGFGRYQLETIPRLNASDVNGGVAQSRTLGLRVSRYLETGGTLSLTASTTSSTSESRLLCGSLTGPSSSCVFHTADASIQLQQPLLRGLGFAYAERNVRHAKVAQNISTFNRRARAAAIVREVVTAYWLLTLTNQSVAIQRSAVDLAREQLRATEAQISVGKRAPIDAAAAEQAINNRMIAVEMAEQQAIDRTALLRDLMGLGGPPPYPNFVTGNLPAPSLEEFDDAALVQRAIDNNPQIQASRLGIELSAVDLAAARSLLLPRVDLDAELGTGGKNRNLGTALGQTGGFTNRSVSVGLTVDFPLLNREARGRMQVARLAGEQAQISVEELDRDLRRGVFKAVNALRSAWRRIDLAKKTVTFAEKNLKAEKARFALAMGTNNDVLRVQQDLNAAQVQVVSTTVDFVLAQADLDALTGAILDRHGVVLRERD
jgi:outer membrane protein